jgi:peptidoglycan hydrolase-like protein with peptidoglycan-binding domain
VTGLPTVDVFLAELRSKLGVGEQPLGSNCQEFSHYLGRPCESWCGDYQAASAKRTSLILPSYSAYTPTMAQGFKDAERWGSRPAKGAFGFVWHTSLGRIAHVFAVEAVNQDGSVGTLEGNSNNTGGREGLYVCRHRRTLVKGSTSWVVGFGYPKYAVPVAKTVTRPADVPKWWTHTVRLHDVSQEVASVCVRLNVRPRVTFDANLDALVRYVQKAHHLHVDGVVGPDTARAIG